MRVTGFEKEGPILVCLTDDNKNRSYTLNFATGEIKGLDGRTLKTTNAIMEKIQFIKGLKNKTYYFGLYAFTKSSGKSYLSIAESLLSYPDLINDYPKDFHDAITYILEKCEGKLPKGYIKWCKEQNVKIHVISLENFYIHQMLTTWPEQLVKKIDQIKVGGLGIYLVKDTCGDQELCNNLVHILDNSLKRYEINDALNLTRRIISLVRTYPNLRTYLDPTKNLSTVYKILMEAKNKERNKQVKKVEEQLKSLDGVIIDGLMIKIPFNLKDFTDEGEQQHNCVGHYYHNEIAKNKQLIYFLRRPKNPEKSYITCRFEVKTKKTVETRVKNNVQYTNDKLFKKIDKMIKDLL